MSNSQGKHRARISGRIGWTLAFLVVGIFLALTLSIRDQGAVERYRTAQFTLSQIEVQVQEIHSLEWLAIAAQEMTPEAEVQLQSSRAKLLIASSGLQLQTQGGSDDLIDPALVVFVQAADRQLRLIQDGKFGEARRQDFEEISQPFDILLHQLHQAADRGGRAEDAAAAKSRNELAAAVFLATISVFGLFLRIHRQRQLMLDRQTTLEHSEDRFRALTEKSADVVFITDAMGIVNYVSPSVQTALACGENVFVGRNLVDLVPSADIPKIRIATKVAVGENKTVELRFHHADGRWLDFECVVRNLLKVENISGLVFNARDVTERKKVEEQLAFNASHDQLTGLPNRVFFLNRLQTVVGRMERHKGQMAAVLFVDVDDLKVVNDCMGHAAGDELLLDLGARLKSCMRKDGSVSRMGGDEFAVLLEDIRNPSDAIRVAQRIQGELSKPFMLAGQEVCKGISIGIALASPKLSAEGLVQNADMAMYRAKSKGKGRTEMFDTAMHEHAMGQLQLEMRLGQALQRCELKLHYQPIVTVRTGRIEGFEALLRWQPDGRAAVSPAVFIPVAEQSGLIVPIGSWVLATGCREAVSWHRRYPAEEPLYVSLNVSALQFSHPAFIGHVADALKKSQILPEFVKIELTESVAMNDAPGTEQTMSQLRSLGVKLSIDDFGTGYSSLSYLGRFAVDTLKIDQSFVSAMEGGRENSAIVESIITLGHSLGLEVVAEGVETSSQLKTLRSFGCDSVQGYYFSKPISPDAIQMLIDQNQRLAAGASA